jgi:multiple antibiotic resistance protein
VPIFLALTKTYTAGERARIATIESATVFIVLVAASLSGETLLNSLGTSLASFRVGGGIVFLLMGLAMLRAQSDMVRSTPAEEAEAEDKHTIAVVPLAVISISMVCLILWLVSRMAASIGRVLGQTGLNIITRLFGLILAAIAVEIMANGLKQLFPVLAG